jgi:LysM repeat protein
MTKSPAHFPANFPVPARATGCGRAGPARARPLLMASLLPSLVVAVAAPAWAQATGSRFPVTEEQRQTAEKVAQAGVPLSELVPGAPERYTIKRGDTLWAISVLYLKSPWRWPELWGMNRTQIANPHLIYPGQQLVLVKTAEGRAILRLAGAGDLPAPAPAAEPPAAAPAAAAPPAPPALPVVKLEPRVRDLGDITKEPIPSIPNRLIEPFLSQPMVVSAGEMAKYPRIVATPEDRVFLGRGDRAYARGIDDPSQTDFHVFRPARPLFDPENPGGPPIAYEAYFLGSARVIKRGEVSTLKIVDSRREIGVNDRLVPIEHEALITYAPHRPLRSVQGSLISVYGGLDDVGAESIVALNRGAQDGLDIGTVLAVNRNGQTVPDRTAGSREFIKLPDERIGQMFVFRVSDHIAYALVMSATGPIKVGDRFGLPDQPADRASYDEPPGSGGQMAVAR